MREALYLFEGGVILISGGVILIPGGVVLMISITGGVILIISSVAHIISITGGVILINRHTFDPSMAGGLLPRLVTWDCLPVQPGDAGGNPVMGQPNYLLAAVA